MARPSLADDLGEEAKEGYTKKLPIGSRNVVSSPIGSCTQTRAAIKSALGKGILFSLGVFDLGRVQKRVHSLLEHDFFGVNTIGAYDTEYVDGVVEFA